MTAPMPSLFVPHGAPTLALDPGTTAVAFERLAAIAGQPRAIVVVSAHWDTDAPAVGFADAPETIHDFWGFPETLYAIRYPARGSREASERVAGALEAAGLGPVHRDRGRGLDHGAWIPLRLMFPDAPAPVIPVSIQSRHGAAHALRLGRALAPLAREGFLVVGSGNLTHNLLDWRRVAGEGAAVPAYVDAFPEWVAAQLDAGDVDALVDYRSRAPGALQAHPTDEHLLPLHVALGAAGTRPRAQRVHAGVSSNVLAMDAYAFRAGEVQA